MVAGQGINVTPPSVEHKRPSEDGSVGEVRFSITDTLISCVD